MSLSAVGRFGRRDARTDGQSTKGHDGTDGQRTDDHDGTDGRTEDDNADDGTDATGTANR